MTNKSQIERPLFGEADSWAACNRHLFPSDAALRWFFRNHRATLIERGAVVYLRARPFVTANFDQAVADLATDAAARAA